jgi:putative SOS response-associated peptidase YedK
MCFHTKQEKDAKTLENRFKAKVKNGESFHSGIYNGFDHPKTPVILNSEPEIIQHLEWGLLPAWAKDIELQNSTLNAKIETLRERPSFNGVLHQKCLVLLDGFYEWKWHDEKGKVKEKFLLSMPNEEPFALAGLWSTWTNPQNGEIKNTYTIITTEAKGIMREIHNTKLRMPVILKKDTEMDWLMDKSSSKLEYLRLCATSLEPRTPSLF